MKTLFIICFLLVCLPPANHAQIITTIAGTGVASYTGDSGPASTATFNYPCYIAIDSKDDLYIADRSNNAIRKINTSGIITTIAGNGTPGFSGDNGPATAAQLHSPICIAIDNVDNLYIVDGYNARIRKISNSGIITTVAGFGGVSGYSGDNGPATAAEVLPYGVALDASGNIYISDGVNNVVRKVNSLGIITTIGGKGTAGFSGDGSAATNAQFETLGDIAVKSTGEVYVPVWGSYRVRAIDNRGIVNTIAGIGTSGYAGDNGAATAAEFMAPNCVNFDKSSNYYISDNYAHVIRKVNSSGIITTIAGNGTAGDSGDNGPATAAQLNNPNSIAMNSSGDIFIADVLNNKIRKISYNDVGVKQVVQAQPDVVIYPNPTHTEITVKADKEIESVELINIIGASMPDIAVVKPYKTQQQLNVSTLPNGIYFVKVNGVYAGRFVKE